MIQINDLGYSYGRFEVLKNITMTLEEGRIYGLLGENGVGKTTLLTLLSGLKKVEDGHIDIDGQNPYDRNPSLLSEIYYLSDEVPSMHITAMDFAQSYGAFREKFDMNTFTEIMKLLETDTKQWMDKMSFGQLKKTHIAFAIACHTKYLFMDEPTNGLDIPSKTQFRKALLKYIREDATVLISTHQVRDLENIIDPIIILDRKDVLLCASIEEITQKLYFDYGNIKIDNALYCDISMAGSVQVCLNQSGQESKVNLEALFNTIHLNKQLCKAIFVPKTDIRKDGAALNTENQQSSTLKTEN